MTRNWTIAIVALATMFGGGALLVAAEIEELPAATAKAVEQAQAPAADDDTEADWRFKYEKDHWWYFSTKNQWLVNHNDTWIAPDDDGRYRYKGKSIFADVRPQNQTKHVHVHSHAPSGGTVYNNRPPVRVNGYIGNYPPAFYGGGPYGVYGPYGPYGYGGYPYYGGGSGTRVGVAVGNGGSGVIIGGRSGGGGWGVSIGNGGGFY